MSFYFSTGTSTVERILRLSYGNMSIGTSYQDSLGTSDIRQSLEDSERYILGLLEDTISLTPSPAPNSLSFAADYLAAYFVYTNIFSANKPNEPSPVVISWKVMADKMVDSYKKGYNSPGQTNVAGKHSYTPIFKERGVKGLGDGILEDSKDIKTSKFK